MKKAMVEIWLPFGEYEIPILLEEPVAVNRCEPTAPELEEDSSPDLTDLLEEDQLRINFSPETNEPQRALVLETLLDGGVECQEVDGDSVEAGETVLAGVVQPNPLFRFADATSAYLQLLPKKSRRSHLRRLYEGESDDASTHKKELLEEALEEGHRLYDFILGPAEKLVSARALGTQADLEETIREYRGLWTSSTPLEGFVVASAGGVLWDHDFTSSAAGIVSVFESGSSPNGVLFLAESARGLGMPVTELWDVLEKGRVYGSRAAALWKLSDMAADSDTDVAVLSSVPSNVVSKMGFTPVTDAEEFLAGFPKRQRSEVTLVPQASPSLVD